MDLNIERESLIVHILTVSRARKICDSDNPVDILHTAKWTPHNVQKRNLKCEKRNQFNCGIKAFRISSK